MEGDFTGVDVNHPGGAGNLLPNRRRRKVTQLNLNSHRSLVGIEQGRQGHAGRSLQQADEMGRGEDGGHSAFGEIDGVLVSHLEGKFAAHSNLRTALHDWPGY